LKLADWVKVILRGVITTLLGHILINVVLPSLPNLLNLPFTIKIELPTSIVVSAIVMLTATLIFYSRTKRHGYIIASTAHRRPERPERIKRKFGVNLFGVQWDVLYGSHLLGSADYAFCDGGPYCLNCSYEMNAKRIGLIRKRYHWICDMCGRTYKCPDNNPYARDKVERYAESEIRSGRIQL
jgi:hypothetical protein